MCKALSNLYTFPFIVIIATGIWDIPIPILQRNTLKLQELSSLPGHPRAEGKKTGFESSSMWPENPCIVYSTIGLFDPLNTA